MFFCDGVAGCSAKAIESCHPKNICFSDAINGMASEAVAPKRTVDCDPEDAYCVKVEAFVDIFSSE